MIGAVGHDKVNKIMWPLLLTSCILIYLPSKIFSMIAFLLICFLIMHQQFQRRWKPAAKLMTRMVMVVC